MVRETLKKYKIDHLHYIAPMQNMPSIIVRGIFSYNRVKKIKHINLSIWPVQKRRERIMDGTSRPIHDYVPLYFATHTPMQRVLTCKTKRGAPKVKQEDLVFIEIDAIKIFLRGGVYFTDGNAASYKTNFYSDIQYLSQLHWDIIRNQKCYSPEYKRKKSAEVLVPNKVPVENFLRIKVYNNYALHVLRAKINEFLDNYDNSISNIDHKMVSSIEFIVDKTHYYNEAEVAGND